MPHSYLLFHQLQPKRKPANEGLTHGVQEALGDGKWKLILINMDKCTVVHFATQPKLIKSTYTPSTIDIRQNLLTSET